MRKNVKKNFMSRVLIFIVLLLIFTFGCQKNDKADIANGVNLVRNNSKVIITPIESDLLGIEFSVSGEILDNSVEVLDNGTLTIVKRYENETIISIASNGVSGLGVVLNNIDSKVIVKALQKVSNMSVNDLNIKKAGEKLLGDFNQDNIVDFSDFILFSESFGKSNLMYDIGPATKGSGNWKDIYCFSAPDGVIDLNDLVVFAGNYGKIGLTELPIVVDAITIIGKNSIETNVKIGDTKNLSAVASLSDNTSTSNNIRWESTNTQIATVVNGIVTFLNEGTVTIKASSQDKSDSINFIITKKEDEKPKDPEEPEIPENNDVNIYYYSTTGAPTIWAWELNGKSISELMGYTWAGQPTMEKVPGADNWYLFTIPENIGPFDKSLSIKLNQTLELTKPSVTTGWYKDGKWTDNNPDGPQIPTISPSPAGASFTSATVSVTLNIHGTNVTTMKYTLDGTDPKTSSTAVSFTSGTKITIGSDMDYGSSKTLKIYALNSEGEVNKSYVYNKVKEVIVPTGLGALYTNTATVFKIWSPDTSNVVVNVAGTDYTCTKLPDENGYTNVYGVTVNGDLHLTEYQFKIKGKAVRDPYGVMINKNNKKNIVIDMSKTEPDGGWVEKPEFINREDAVVYEIHVRDFTLDSTSGVSEANRGKYLGMVETGTTYNGVKTGIDHLKEMGVTHVQLLPIYDFSTEMYNWGYDPENYNIPEEQYSAHAATEYVKRIKEFKTMINEFHRNGIRVVMDVVYNHTYGDEMFEDITLQYFTGNDDSGCGNGINTGVPMVSRFIRDSLEFWVKEYNMDGFRFDLIGIFHYSAVKEWGEYLNVQKYPNRNLLMYGEPWNGYWLEDPIENQKVRMGSVPAIASGHIGVFNGKYREDIKGDNDGKRMAYMFNQPTSWWGAIAAGMRGSLVATKSTNVLPDMWDSMFAYDPEQSINYISAHDNYCLWDKIVYSGATGGATGYAGRVAKFGIGMILTSQGVPFLHGGDEILRSKVYNGDWKYAHNTYNAPDAYNKVYWNLKVENKGIFDYHKDLIKIRKENPGLRLTTWDEVKSRMKTEINHASAGTIHCVNNSSLPDKVVVSYYDNDNNVNNGYELAVVYNPGNDFNISLPDGNWVKIFDANGAVNKTDKKCEGTAVTIFKKQ